MAARKRQARKSQPRAPAKKRQPEQDGQRSELVRARRSGRKSKLTEELTEELCTMLRAGAFIENACAAVGIPSRTMRVWLQKGAESKRTNRFTRFRDAVMEAEAECEADGAKQIQKAGKDDWRAAAWLMERRFSRRWAQRVRIQIEDELDRMLDRAEQVLPPEAYELLLEVIAADDSEEATGSETGEG